MDFVLTGGEGVLNPEKFVNVICACLQRKKKNIVIEPFIDSTRMNTTILIF